MTPDHLLAAASFSPKSLQRPSAWVGHLPFAAWIIQQIAPRIFVELGTHSGNSYLAFCQSVAASGGGTSCYAVDTWQGDDHAGQYSDDIFNTVDAHNQAHYAGFSHLLRMTFDEALDQFPARSIGLLHIDGLHTYEAVRHDFETWLPKLAPGAVVLFHDTHVRESNFGVWKLWSELQALYPNHLEFVHSHGLGVLQLNNGPEEGKLPWLRPGSPDKQSLQHYFTALGSRQLERCEVNELNQAMTDRDVHIAHLNQVIADLNQAVTGRDQHITHLNRQLEERDAKMHSLVTSRSWYFTKPIRFIGRTLRSLLRSPPSHLPAAAAAPTAPDLPVAAADLSPADTAPAQPAIPGRWGIMATSHTLFIAHLIADRLLAHGWRVDIMTQAPASFDLDMYVVVCPQMFTSLPPGQQRIAFQMEQSVTSRWFTDGYLDTLRNSLAVFEYAMTNIDFMVGKALVYPHVYYLPVGALKEYGPSTTAPEKTCDVLFYGDSLSSARRREMLDALKPHFNVCVVNEVFGPDMQQAIQQAKLVINLHYYDNALLEMPRIQECLSLGVPVVSESAQDQDDYPELHGAVHFFEQGSIPAMISAVRAALAQPVSPEVLAASVAHSAQRFCFMLDRFLLAMNYLPASDAARLQLPLAHDAVRFALSLPETIARRHVFEKEKPADCVIFDGIRHQTGWIGCGLSYNLLARHAVKNGLTRVTIMEDDVLLPDDFEAKMAIVDDFLTARTGQWDVFAGIVAALHPEVQILSVESFKGITFVTINKMTSMVFNVYGEKVLQLLASWDPTNLDVVSNTIDRFLENQADLRIVVALPFFVGHRDEVHSTLWGFKNSQYNDMIASSQKSLEDRVLAHPGWIPPGSQPSLFV